MYQTNGKKAISLLAASYDLNTGLPKIIEIVIIAFNLILKVNIYCTCLDRLFTFCITMACMVRLIDILTVS